MRDIFNSVDARTAGVDEAGRGPWAGPVVAAAVILNPSRVPEGLDDSKKLSRAARERLYGEIVACSTWGVGVAEVEEIDRDNILNAALHAMALAVAALDVAPTLALVDGNRAPTVACDVRTVVGGDGCVACISAASIVAKVTRDRMMAALSVQHPGYGWERNAGYGTAEHRAALDRLGVTPAHRRSFAPIRARLADSTS